MFWAGPRLQAASPSTKVRRSAARCALPSLATHTTLVEVTVDCRHTARRFTRRRTNRRLGRWRETRPSRSNSLGGIVKVTCWFGDDVAGSLTRWPKSHTVDTGFRQPLYNTRCGSTCASRSAIETSRIFSPSVGSTLPTKPSGAGC